MSPSWAIIIIIIIIIIIRPSQRPPPQVREVQARSKPRYLHAIQDHSPSISGRPGPEKGASWDARTPAQWASVSRDPEGSQPRPPRRENWWGYWE